MCPSSYELKFDKPVLPEIEHLKGKIGEGLFELLRVVLNLQNIRRISVFAFFSNTKLNQKRVPFPIGKLQGA